MSEYKSVSDLLSFLTRLRKAKIHYRLDQIRDDMLAVHVAVPGERWEIEFSRDGSVEVERFRSDGTILDASALAELLQRFSDG